MSNQHDKKEEGYPSACNSFNLAGILAYSHAQSPASEANLIPDFVRIRVPSYNQTLQNEMIQDRMQRFLLDAV